MGSREGPMESQFPLSLVKRTELKSQVNHRNWKVVWQASPLLVPQTQNTCQGYPVYSLSK